MLEVTTGQVEQVNFFLSNEQKRKHKENREQKKDQI